MWLLRFKFDMEETHGNNVSTVNVIYAHTSAKQASGLPLENQRFFPRFMPSNIHASDIALCPENVMDQQWRDPYN